MNSMKVWLLMGTLTILLVMMGNALGGQSGALLFFIMAMGMNLFGYYYSDKIAIKMTRSYPVTEAQAPDLYAVVRSLAQRASLPMPAIYITPSAQPNAFATGRNPENSAVAVTEGIMRMLGRQELEGVLAHELAHIKNRDVLVGSIAAALAGAISMIAHVVQWGAIFGLGRGNDDEGAGGMIGGLLMAILAPIAAMIIQLSISRSREFGADEDGAAIAGSPHGLADALLKLESAARRIPMKVNPSTSHLFIVNPLSGASVSRLFSTHPPIEERVARLRSMRLR